MTENSRPNTMYALLLKQALIAPDFPALITSDGDILTYRELLKYTDMLRYSLIRAGVSRGGRIAVVLPNGPEMAFAFLGVTAVCTCAPLNPGFSKEEFIFYMTDARCSGLLVLEDHETAARSAAESLGISCYLMNTYRDIIAGKSVIHESASCIDASFHLPDYLSQPEDIALVLHTSGTTAKPKQVPLRQDRISRNALAIAASLSLTPDDRCLNLMPLFHVHGLIGCLLSTFFSGGSVITSPGFQPDSVSSWLTDLQPTWYSAVPAIHYAMIRKAGEHGSLSHSLRFIRSCSSPLPPVLLDELESRFHVPVIEAYGMTEASHQIASNPLPPLTHKPGSVGISTGYEVRILGTDNQDMPERTPGEVCITGPNLFSGYEQNQEANEQSFVKDFFRTGDEGYLDEEGYLFLTGRIKELINKGGEKIAPREIEEVVLAIPGIDQTVAFSIPHPELGEDIGLIIVPKLGFHPDILEIKKIILLHLAPWKVPSRIWVRDEIPKGPTGKVRRREIAGLIEGEVIAHEVDSSPGFNDEPDECLQKIEEIWKKLLNCPSIGYDDDFFAVGGYSLTALAITTELEQMYGVDLPPTILFEASTIRSLAAVIRKKIVGIEISYLISYNISGSGIPLFLVPPGQGNAFYYRELAAQLGNNQPFYSFSWLPLDAVFSIEEMARVYIDELLQVSPDGPVLLGGYCFGAVVALEMAKQLVEQGREVRCLFILDPEILLNGPDWKYEPKRQTKREWMEWLTKGGPRLWYQYVFGLICRRRRECRRNEHEKKQRTISISHLRMLESYNAKRYPEDVTIFHYEKPNQWIIERWPLVCSGNVAIIHIPDSKHHEVLHKGMERIVQSIFYASDKMNVRN